ncbi:MAG: alkanesulfonate monooxygenase SsuD [Gammaproteobacteria bacterium]|jgi:alkanesulfonate monooxygenase SsuD/methylene tetrahydromethanopterin reductase-like flavin-dependent oxidoreductase (luciferase family)
MATKIDFGMFDWLDRAPGTTADLYESRIQLIARADEAGFYGYHMAEHHGTALGMSPSPSLFFAALAQRTKNIRFSPMAFLLPMYHPVRLIEEVCMLDHLSNGRVEVGISRGVSPHEIRCFGIDPDETREIFAETLEIFRLGMANDVLNYSGKHFTFRDAPMPIKPLQLPHPPIWYPSFSEAGATYAAENGFHYMSLGPPSLTAALNKIYRDVAAAHPEVAQRMNGGAPKIGANRQIFIAETEEEAIKIAKPAYEYWYKSITELWHRNSDHTYDEFFSWDPCFAGEVILIGSVDKVRDQIQKIVDDCGINYFIGSFAWGSLTPEQSRRSLDLFISEIMPTIKA